jgi:class 3 adenylate cyclase
VQIPAKRAARQLLLVTSPGGFAVTKPYGTLRLQRLTADEPISFALTPCSSGIAMTAIDEKLLEERLTALESARTWSPRLVSKLESHIRSASDVELLRINPLKFAADKSLKEEEAIDLFLHAAALGLFEMTWILICPICSCVIDSFRALKNLRSHCRCNHCHVDLVAALDDMIAITFTVNPAIRRIAYHDPETLSVEDYLLRYRSANEGLIPDGTPFVKMREMLIRALAYVEPGKTTALEVNAEAGALHGSSSDSNAGIDFIVDPALPPGEQRIAVRLDFESSTPNTGTVAPGKVIFELTNVADKRFDFGVLQLPPGVERPPPLTFAPFLSGKRLLTTQTFRDLFRSEVTRGSEGLGVKDIALLFTDLKGSTALYDRIGDLNAFALVQQHFDRLQEVTVRHNGAIIKTIGDAVMAAFLKPADAVQAALDMRSEIASFNERQPDKALILKIGVHTGAAIAVTLNDRLDYFGQTVNIAARVQNLADADEIFVSQDVYDADDVRDRLAVFAVEPRTAQLRGVQQELPVFRIRAAAAA